MKSFTTPEYIEPIITHFKAFYTPIKDKAILTALNCDVLLKNNHSGDYKAIRNRDCFYVYCTPVKDVYNAIQDFANYASTYEGELDQWMYDEQERLQNTIKNRLIELYA